jgi:hypothetical protein
MAPIPNGRASTVSQKSMMLQAILNSWLKCPDLRLGQLIVCAMRDANPNVPLFYIEDYILESAIIEMARKFEKR